MPLPFSCPMCGRLTIRRLLENVQITANLEHELRHVGGLSAFICETEGHICFVLQKDLGETAAQIRRHEAVI
jgi:hypothetical protein